MCLGNMGKRGSPLTHTTLSTGSRSAQEQELEQPCDAPGVLRTDTGGCDLNVCPPPNSYIGIPACKGDGVRRWGLLEVIGHGDGAPVIALIVSL